MTYLRTLNNEKSLSVVRDYFTSVDMPGVSPALLLEKRRKAEKALDHLSGVINPSNMDNQDCSGCGDKQTA